MVQFREASVVDPSPRALLADYFASRARTFPASMGEYRVAPPTPSDFVSPTGVFLVVEDAVDAITEDAADPGTADVAGAEHESDDVEGGSARPSDRVADVGCGGIRLVAGDTATRRYEIKHLWVSPIVRGRGLGRMLLAELESRALQLGADEVVLDTNAAQEAAASLYRATGYVEIPPYNDNPNATHWFAKTLRSEPA